MEDEVVGSGKWATSIDKATSPQPMVILQNYFDELALENDDNAEFEFGFALPDKNESSSFPYTVVALAHCATVQSTSHSFSQLAQQQLGQMHIAPGTI